MNKVKLKRLKSIGVFIITSFVFLAISVFCSHDIIRKSIGNEYSFPIDFLNSFTITDNFDESSVIVILDQQVSGLNKQHKKNYFKDIEVEEIEDLTASACDNSISQQDGFEQILLLKLPQHSKRTVLDTIEKLSEIKGVKYAGPNRNLQASRMPNDPFYLPQSNNVLGQWGLDKIKAPLIWNQTTGSSNIRVGVMDSGIAKHLDLDANVEQGWDFYNMVGSIPSRITDDDDNGHGTHVAGIIGAVGNNKLGITGTNWNISLVPMQVDKGDGFWSLAAAVRAINYAVDTWNTEERISILNFSAGDDVPLPELELVIRRYSDIGGLFVCATGNKAMNNDAVRNYPSFYASELHTNPISNMITVGRSDINDERPNGANWGKQTITLFAPGQDIISTVPGTYPYDVCYSNGLNCKADGTHIAHGYHSMSGSSMAAPHVTGVAALLLSKYPNLTGSGLKAAILNGVHKTESLEELCVTGGRLDAYNAMLEVGKLPIFETNAAGNMVTGIHYMPSGGKLTIPQEINGKAITSVAKNAFLGQRDLKSIIIPDSVTIIEESAFEDCSSLTEVRLSADSALSEIGMFAFKNCTALTGITLPAALQTIRVFAFDHCSSLRSITIPSSVTTIEPVFSDCDKLTIYCEADDPPDGWEPNWNVSNRPVFWGCTLSADRSYVRAFPKQAGMVMNCPDDTQIHPPYRQGYAFYNWNNHASFTGNYYTSQQLASAAAPSDTVYHALWAENNAVCTVSFDTKGGAESLADVDVRFFAKVTKPDIDPTRMYHIFSHWSLEGEAEAYDFAKPVLGDIRLEANWLPGGLKFVPFGAGYAVSGTALTLKELGSIVVIPAAYEGLPVLKIDVNAFRNMAGIHSVTIPPSVTEIGSRAFAGCSGLQTVTIPGSVSHVGTDVFQGCSADILWEYNGANSLTAEGFCDNLTAVQFMDGVTSIRKNAFKNCSALLSVTVPPSVTEIGAYAFYGCTALSAFSLPNQIVSIGAFAFYNCRSVTGLLLPRSVVRIGDGAFGRCSGLAAITVETGNTVFEAEGNCLLLKEDKTLLVLGCKNSVIPAAVTEIGAYAFYGCSGLSEFVLPSAVSKIGAYAFYNCANLTRIGIPEGTTEIGAYAFYRCAKLASLTLPESILAIGDNAFSSCAMIESLYLPSSIEYLGNHAFAYCGRLVSVVFGAETGLTDIGGFAFYECLSLKSIAIPSSIKAVHDYAFGRCESLSAVVFAPDSALTVIASKAFYFCGQLKSIALPDGVQSIGNNAFSFSGLKSVTLPEMMQAVDKNAFAYCEELTVVYIEKSSQSGTIAFDREVFEGCEELKLIVFPDSGTLLEYRYVLPEYVDILNCIGLNTVVVTVMEEIGVDTSFPFHRFDTIYDIRYFYDHHGFDDQCIEKGVIFYIPRTSHLQYVLPLFDAMLYQSYDMGIACAVISAVPYVHDVPVVGRDWYSRGFNIGVAYTEAIAESYSITVPEVLDMMRLVGEYETFFPVMAPEWYTSDLCFLRGLSDALDVPVKIISNADEMQDMMYMVQFWTGLNFQEWLLVDIEYEDIQTQLSFLYGTINPANFHFFVTDCEKAEGLELLSDRLYLVSDKVDYISAIGTGLEEGAEIYYSDWVFDAQTKWFENNYQNRYPDSEWTDLWENLGYWIRYDIWYFTYDSYFSSYPLYLVEQIVIAL